MVCNLHIFINTVYTTHPPYTVHDTTLREDLGLLLNTPFLLGHSVLQPQDAGKPPHETMWYYTVVHTVPQLGGVQHSSRDPLTGFARKCIPW